MFTLGSCAPAHLGLHAEMKFIGNIWKTVTLIGSLYFHNAYCTYVITFFKLSSILFLLATAYETDLFVMATESEGWQYSPKKLKSKPHTMPTVITVN